MLKPDFQKFLSAGFSMTEVMIGGAILAGVALGGARMFKDQRQSQTKLDQDQYLISFHQQLTKFIQNEKNCNATFQGAWNFSPAQMATFDVDNFMECTTCTATNVDYDASVSTTTPVATSFGEGQWTDPKAYMWRITDISWKTNPATGTPMVPTATGNAVLRITYGTDPSWPNSRAKKAFSLTKDINIMLRFTQDAVVANRQFKECISVTESSINNLQNDICGAMGGSISTIGSIMVWSDAAQGCVSLGSTSTPLKTCSTANMVIDGINADGTVRCRSITNGVVPSTDLMDNVGCAPGTSIRMEYDTATQKLKARCF